MLVPTRVSQMMSKSASLGAAELQTGTLMWSSPGYSALSPSMASERLTSSLTSTSSSFLLMSTYLSLPPFSLTLPSTTFLNSTSPILWGGRAQMGTPLTYTLGSCLRLSQMILPSLGEIVPQTFSRTFLNPSRVGCPVQ